MEKRCSRCAEPFYCQQNSRGCWCESLYVAPEQLARLKESFDNCLCPQCLALYETEPPVAAAPPSTK